MKHKQIIFISLFIFIASAALAAQDQSSVYYKSEFYQKFVSAEWAHKSGDDAKALELYLELDQELPQDPAILKSIIELAIDKEDTVLMDKYVPILVQVASEEPTTLSIYATWLWSKGRFADALDNYRLAMEKDPDNPETVFKYVTLLTSIDSDKAIEFLGELSQKYPKMAGLIALQVADLYVSAGDVAGAEAYLKQAQNKTPYLPQPYVALAKIYEAQGKTQEALQEYLTMEELGLADADTLVKIGAYYVLGKQKDLSQEYFLKAKAMDDGNPSAAQFLMLSAQEHGDYAQAYEYIKAGRTFASSADNFVRASYFLNRTGDLKGSSVLLKQAYEKFDTNAEVALYYAYALMDLDDHKAARKVLEHILSYSPDNQSALFSYALILERQKEYRKMEDALSKIIQLNPEHANALNFLGYHLVDKTNRIEEGGKYIIKAVSLEPSDTAFIDSMAWYYYKKGEYQKSLDLLKSLDGKEIDDSEILYHLGAVNEALENYTDAQKYYNQVLALDPQNKTVKKAIKRIDKKLSSK